MVCVLSADDLLGCHGLLNMPSRRNATRISRSLGKRRVARGISDIETHEALDLTGQANPHCFTKSALSSVSCHQILALTGMRSTAYLAKPLDSTSVRLILEAEDGILPGSLEPSASCAVIVNEQTTFHHLGCDSSATLSPSYIHLGQ